MSPVEVGLLTLLGSVVFLDDWPIAQSAISRPLVVGSMIGLILDRPVEGVVWGAVFEAAYLRGMPVGAARLPVAGLAALVGTAVALAGPGTGPEPAGWVLASGVLAGIAGERVGGLHRRWNVRTAARAAERLASGDPRAPGRAVAISILRAAALGAGVTLGSLIVALGALAAADGRLWLAPLPLTTIAVVGAAALLLNGARLFVRERRRLAAWGVGALVGYGLTALVAL